MILKLPAEVQRSVCQEFGKHWYQHIRFQLAFTVLVARSFVIFQIYAV